MDWIELNELAQEKNRSMAENVLKQMANLANRRLERLSKLSLPSPAFSNREILDKNGFASRDINGNFLYEEFQSTGLTDLRDIRHELKHIQSFLKSETSTVKGAKRYSADVIKRVENYSSIKEAEKNMWNYEESKILWSAYRELADGNITKALVDAYIGSDSAQEITRYLQKNNDYDAWEYLRKDSQRVMEDIVDIVQGKYSAENLTRLAESKDPADNLRYKQLKTAEHIYYGVLEGRIKLNS